MMASLFNDPLGNLTPSNAYGTMLLGLDLACGDQARVARRVPLHLTWHADTEVARVHIVSSFNNPQVVPKVDLVPPHAYGTMLLALDVACGPEADARVTHTTPLHLPLKL